jgi:DNA mismatch endonuclease, patch repair protein
MDKLSPSERSELMSRVRGKDTQPELCVRRLAHALGFRFRLHRRDLPGKPDLVFPKYKTAVFVHGCFWHQHTGCRKATIPATRSEFWCRKLYRNVERDAVAASALAEMGWHVGIFWECQTGNTAFVERSLQKLLLKPRRRRAA